MYVKRILNVLVFTQLSKYIEFDAFESNIIVQALIKFDEVGSLETHQRLQSFYW